MLEDCVHKLLLREEPLVVYNLSDVLAADPVLSALHEQAMPYVSKDEYPPDAMALLDQAAERIAHWAHSQLGKVDQRRYMALADAFAKDGQGKTVGNIYRTNGFSREDAEGGLLYEIVSRLNHSCVPNVVKELSGFTAVVKTLRDIEAGEELRISYTDEHAGAVDLDDALTARKRRESLSRKYNFWCQCERCAKYDTS